MDGRITAYDEDYFAWTQQQAQFLREAGRQRINTPIDWDHIAGELDLMGGQIKDAMRSHLATVIEHLLKLEHSPDAYPRRKWRISARAARRHLADKLEDQPSLKSWPAQVLPKAWADGCDQAYMDDSIPDGAFPADCPWTLAQLLDNDFWPVNRHGLE